MRILFFLLTIYFPNCLIAQAKIEYSDIIGQPKIDSKLIFYKNFFNEFNINLECFLKIKQSYPFPEIEVYYLGEKKIKAQGHIFDVKSDTCSLIIKLIRPVCCCLYYKEITVIKYDKVNSVFYEDEYFIHKDLLLPISDVVFDFQRIDNTLIDLVLYRAPNISSFEEYDECTGEVIDGSIIGVYKLTNFYYLIYKTNLWELVYIPVESNNKSKNAWILGWRYTGKL